MTQPSAKVLLVLTALGLLCAGPAAACACADEPPAAMPCCPDEPANPAHTVAEHSIDAGCVSVADDARLPGTPDFPQPAMAASREASPWLMSRPPATIAATAPEPHESPPIYLVTLRLRD